MPTAALMPAVSQSGSEKKGALPREARPLISRPASMAPSTKLSSTNTKSSRMLKRITSSPSRVMLPVTCVTKR